MSCTSLDFVQVITCTTSCTSYNLYGWVVQVITCTKSFSNFVQVITCTKIMPVQVITCTALFFIMLGNMFLLLTFQITDHSRL